MDQGVSGLKLLFIYESNHPVVVEDGLWTALNALEPMFTITRTNIAFEKDFVVPPCDFVLGWGAFGSHVDMMCQHIDRPKGLCIAGNAFSPSGALSYDVLFYETKWYRKEIDFHPNIIQAFGYNDLVYKNLGVTERDVDYLGVGAYASWKRWEMMLNKTGTRRVIGEYQRGNPIESQAIWDRLEKGGVICKDMMKPEYLVYEYNRAKTVYIPSNIYGGGERAILEARACGCKVEVEPDNPKLMEVMAMPLWTHQDYASRLQEGICQSL